MKKLFLLQILVLMSLSAVSQSEGLFSVSETKKIVFSQGNLQYHKDSNVWRFAEDQLLYLGENNNNIETGGTWIDLFGWSGGIINKYYPTASKSTKSSSEKSSKHNNKATADNQSQRDPKFGVNTSIMQYDYFGSFVDWGVKQIGSDSAEVWRTLTAEEWNYIFEGRKNASALWGVAQVWGVNGLILLPDNWVAPEGVFFKPGFYEEEDVWYFSVHQTFTQTLWLRMQQAGAVFLPASGYRFGAGASNMEYCGYYWSASADGSNRAVCLYFDSDGKSMDSNYRHYGLSVRLVKDVVNAQ
jgi:hypothetical protein